MAKKISCERCTSCCSNIELVREKELPISLSEYPVGSTINYEGISLKRNDCGWWDCVFYDKKKRRCEIYDIRPTLCRVFYCEGHRKKSKFPKKYVQDHRYYYKFHYGEYENETG